MGDEPGAAGDAGDGPDDGSDEGDGKRPVSAADLVDESDFVAPDEDEGDPDRPDADPDDGDGSEDDREDGDPGGSDGDDGDGGGPADDGEGQDPVYDYDHDFDFDFEEADPEPVAQRHGGPHEDQEMPLADHIEEMLKRLAVVVAIAGVVSVVTFPFAERLINVMWYSILSNVSSELARPRVYGVLELKLTEFKVASLAGLIVALPVLVYETYQFMRPGLYPHERRYYLAAIPTSLVLAIVGVSFAYFVILPAIFTYFLYYSQDVAQIGFALGRTFNLILLLMGYMALVFQIPLFIMLAMMMGLVTRRWLADRRILFWGAFLGISFVFSPDPTGMAPIVVALTMIALFEGTLLLTRWTGRS